MSGSSASLRSSQSDYSHDSSDSLPPNPPMLRQKPSNLPRRTPRLSQQPPTKPGLSQTRRLSNRLDSVRRRVSSVQEHHQAHSENTGQSSPPQHSRPNEQDRHHDEGLQAGTEGPSFDGLIRCLPDKWNEVQASRREDGQKIASLQQVLQEERERNRELQARLAECEDSTARERQARREETKALQDQIVQLENKLGNAVRTLTEAEIKGARLQKKADLLQVQVTKQNDLLSTYDALRSKHNVLSSKYDELLSKHNDLQKDFAEIKEWETSATNAANEERETSAELQTLNNSLEEGLRVARARIETLTEEKAELAQNKEMTTLLANNFHVLKAQIASLQQITETIGNPRVSVVENKIEREVQANEAFRAFATSRLQSMNERTETLAAYPEEKILPILKGIQNGTSSNRERLQELASALDRRIQDDLANSLCQRFDSIFECRFGSLESKMNDRNDSDQVLIAVNKLVDALDRLRSLSTVERVEALERQVSSLEDKSSQREMEATHSPSDTAACLWVSIPGSDKSTILKILAQCQQAAAGDIDSPVVAETGELPSPEIRSSAPQREVSGKAAQLSWRRRGKV
ncbi:hypothetical protein BO82DRAFT_70536 [Aspergillus uvarum CBS 121591]|uniref:Uncharacterized protein n=1 Tax=Aspergillus uvarum CBS 121591 TaxID=1448315 RepID=A0A319C916_9EURO|nr:hypothetical protein BO82DRAFT_70536 [Aspergillus uvarum CBS 121591]PYH81925.1 hypothetical protein BO82DRAFT_70536 [Aspergillus uvarum CBS 121591]